jgi:hypothetical protein
MALACEAEIVTDPSYALMRAAELRSVSKHDAAMIWAQLATFLQQSENYLFDASSDECPPTQWHPLPLRSDR